MSKQGVVWMAGKQRQFPSLGPTSLAQGFTLIEVMVTLAVMAVLLTIGLPSLKPIIDSIRLKSASAVFFSHLHLARSEAIKRNSRVVLCKSADGVSCAGSGGWEQDWLVFHDANNNASLDSGETVIDRAAPLPQGLRFTGNQNVSRYVSFVSSGAAQMVSGAFQAGTFTVCTQSAEEGTASQIILSSVGRARMQRIQLSSCA